MKTIHQYLESENIQTGTDKTLYIKELHIHYLSFCSEKFIDPIGKVNFSKHLKELGFEIKRVNSGMVIFVKK